MFVACIAAVFTVRGSMAGLAFRFSLLTVIDRECVLRQLGRIPAAGFMAVFACQAKESQVYFRLSVTILTIRWRSLVKLVHMAVLASGS